MRFAPFAAMTAAIFLSALLAPTSAPADIFRNTVLEPFFLETEKGDARARSTQDFVLRYLAIPANGSAGALPSLTISLWGSALPPEGAEVEVAYWATPTGGNAPVSSARARTRDGRIDAALFPSSEFLIPAGAVASVKISVDSSRFLPGELWISDGIYTIRYLYR